MHVVICPHCNNEIIIGKINCGIFRHGVIIKTGKQLNSHLKKAKCEQLLINKLIYGCGKPFRIINNGTVIEAIACDYI